MNLEASLDYLSPTPSVVALGCFDGVHLGHAAVIRTAKEQALRSHCDCIVWTFTEPPKNYFAPHSVPLITDQTTKQALIEGLGADTLVCVPFDETVGSLSAEAFFTQILLHRLRAYHLVCGYNYTFGAKGTGNVELLKSLCDTHGIGLTVLPPVKVHNVSVSSSAIRTAIEDGYPEKAAALLGRPYSLSAPVIDGQHLARKLGFPTINQLFPDGMTIPRAGVYATRIHIEGEDFFRYGISNVGLRPTVNTNILCCETHILDYVGDLYQKTVQIEFLTFLRPEQKFDSVEALAEQVRSDIQTARKLLGSQGAEA